MSLVDLQLEEQAGERCVLIVGDGDFSYSKSLILYRGKHPLQKRLRVLATCLDTREELVQRYNGARENLLELENLRLEGVEVSIRFAVDATKLEEYDFVVDQKLDRIVFNFPMAPPTGKKRNLIQNHRLLLQNFFQSCRKVIEPFKGQVWVTLSGGQGGTPADVVKRKYGDSWQIIDMASPSSFVLINAMRFPMKEMEELGYSPRGRRNGNATFLCSNAVTHVFSLDESLIAKQGNILYPKQWTRDLCFFVSEDFKEEIFKNTVEEILGTDEFRAELMELVCFDNFVHPETKKRSKGYRIRFCSRFRAIAQSQANKIVQCIMATQEAKHTHTHSIK